MWIDRAALLIALISGIAITLFAMDILAWTFGVYILPPLQALLRLGLWLVPFAFSLYLPRLSRYWHKTEAHE